MVARAEKETLLVTDPLDQPVDPAPQPVVTTGDVQALCALGPAQHRDPLAVESLGDEFLDGSLSLVGPSKNVTTLFSGAFRSPSGGSEKARSSSLRSATACSFPCPVRTL